MAKATPGTQIIFDDYVDRPAFHCVEEFVPHARQNSRQALFVVPRDVDKELMSAMRDAFLMVRD
jgi:hypothetical protein